MNPNDTDTNTSQPTNSREDSMSNDSKTNNSKTNNNSREDSNMSNDKTRTKEQLRFTFSRRYSISPTDPNYSGNVLQGKVGANPEDYRDLFDIYFNNYRDHRTVRGAISRALRSAFGPIKHYAEPHRIAYHSKRDSSYGRASYSLYLTPGEYDLLLAALKAEEDEGTIDWNAYTFSDASDEWLDAREQIAKIDAAPEKFHPEQVDSDGFWDYGPLVGQRFVWWYKTADDDWAQEATYTTEQLVWTHPLVDGANIWAAIARSQSMLLPEGVNPNGDEDNEDGSPDFALPEGLTPAAGVLATHITSFLHKEGVEHNDGIPVFRAPEGWTNYEGKEPALIVQYSAALPCRSGVGPYFSYDHTAAPWSGPDAYKRHTAMFEFCKKLGFCFCEIDGESAYLLKVEPEPTPEDEGDAPESGAEQPGHRVCKPHPYGLRDDDYPRSIHHLAERYGFYVEPDYWGPAGPSSFTIMRKLTDEQMDHGWEGLAQEVVKVTFSGTGGGEDDAYEVVPRRHGSFVPAPPASWTRIKRTDHDTSEADVALYDAVERALKAAPLVYYVTDSRTAYDLCQTDDVKDGTIFVCGDNTVGVAAGPWPFAVTEENGSFSRMTRHPNRAVGPDSIHISHAAAKAADVAAEVARNRNMVTASWTLGEAPPLRWKEGQQGGYAQSGGWGSESYDRWCLRRTPGSDRALFDLASRHLGETLALIFDPCGQGDWRDYVTPSSLFPSASVWYVDAPDGVDFNDNAEAFNRALEVWALQTNGAILD